MFNFLDLFKERGGGGLAGGAPRQLQEPQQYTGPNGLKQEHVSVDPPNLRKALGRVSDPGSFNEMMRQGRRTGEMPGQQPSMGPAGANYNQTSPEPMAFPQQPAGDAPSLFDNFDSDAFKKRLGQMGAGWAMGQDPDESMRLGNMAMTFGDQLPEDKRLADLLRLLQRGQ